MGVKNKYIYLGALVAELVNVTIIFPSGDSEIFANSWFPSFLDLFTKILPNFGNSPAVVPSALNNWP